MYKEPQEYQRYRYEITAIMPNSERTLQKGFYKEDFTSQYTASYKAEYLYSKGYERIQVWKCEVIRCFNVLETDYIVDNNWSA